MRLIQIEMSNLNISTYHRSARVFVPLINIMLTIKVGLQRNDTIVTVVGLILKVSS